jgi:Outer membrane protein transport protein (OMPP1/FadL/TodX)
VDRRVVCALVALAPAQAHADGIAIVGGSPRAIGRAGAATVGDDGGGALLVNPAAIARRDTLRAQVGVAVVEDAVHWQSAAKDAPLSSGQAGSRLAPLGAAFGSIGHWIVGAGVMTATLSERAMPHPEDAGSELGAAFDYRYAGIAGSYRRDTLALGAARRIGDSLALGLSLGISQVNVTEHRRIWAGLSGRDTIGDPTNDVDVQLTATDHVTASAVVGALYASEDAPIELGASVAWAGAVRLDGSAAALGNAPMGPGIIYTGSPRASLEVRQPLVVRAGGRYVGDRVVAELDGDLWLASAAAASATWRVSGIHVVDPSQDDVELQRVPSRIAQHTHLAMRAAIDVELIPGFLWATGGYAFSTLGTPAAQLSPSFGDLGGHTLGLGLETTAGGITVTLGWSRTWSLATQAPTELQLDNPFATGDGPVPRGTYDGSLDQVGILIEGELTRSTP